MRAIQAADSRNTRHPRSNESASSRPLPSFPSSPVTFPPGMTRRRALDSVPWHYVVPHLLVCGSVTKPPSLQSGNRFPRVVIKAVTFHVTSYLDLWRLFLAGGGRHARISRLAPFIPIDYTRGWINWNRYSAGTLGFPLFRSGIGTLCTLCIGYAVIIDLLSKAVL